MSNQKTNDFTCQGFTAAGISAGIKKNNKKDLGLIYCDTPANVAGVFTKNKICAAPVIIDKKHMTSRLSQAIIANSGNANCCTGQKGLLDAENMALFTGHALNTHKENVLVASTGVIGESLPIDKIENSIPNLVKELNPYGFSDFAESIMTTDTKEKIICMQEVFNKKPFTIIAVAKGSGMISPDMATMLCFVCTDIESNNFFLQDCLLRAVNQSFNRITVDGDMSTNDTVIMLANGMSNLSLSNPIFKECFCNVLSKALMKLAKDIILDGEGATKCVEIAVKGAQTHADARKIADAVANSVLVKTALFGQDANWGRIIAAIGRAGAKFLDPDKIDIYFNDVCLIKNSIAISEEAEKKASVILKEKEFVMTIDLNIGKNEESILTCDLSLEYIKINADYRS